MMASSEDWTMAASSLLGCSKETPGGPGDGSALTEKGERPFDSGNFLLIYLAIPLGTHTLDSESIASWEGLGARVVFLRQLPRNNCPSRQMLQGSAVEQAEELGPLAAKIKDSSGSRRQASSRQFAPSPYFLQNARRSGTQAKHPEANQVWSI